MPIISPVCIRPFDQEAFAKLDYQVMHHAFESQNELGRLCDEVIYQNDLAARLKTARIGPIRNEVPVTVSHGDFSKTFFLDLVVEDAAIYELKATTCLAGEHEAQLLNYLFLCGSRHGKLINFRPPHVETRFINTGLIPEARRRLEFNTQHWRVVDASSNALHKILVGLLEDWGGFLEVSLYVDATIHFLGGQSKVIQEVPLMRNGVPLGNQRLHLIAPDIAFRITALTEDSTAYERELRSLLRHTPLRALQWVNLAHHRIDFVTMAK